MDERMLNLKEKAVIAIRELLDYDVYCLLHNEDYDKYSHIYKKYDIILEHLLFDSEN